MQISDASTDAPALDASGLCGNQILPVRENRPNLYFVVDRSGSMSDPLEGSPYDKYESAQLAIRDVLLAVGHRVAYGAAVFPSFEGATGCEPGEEIYPTAPGDSVTYALAGEVGPNLDTFVHKLAAYAPYGNTPTSLTLEALYDTLTSLSGDTSVVLATDGAPNCNPEAQCGSDLCMADLGGWPVSSTVFCPLSISCCDPDGPYGPVSCVDVDASVAAVKALADAGISTYVVGLPGSELFSEVLDNLAQAGGTARTGEVAYYRVEDSDALSESLRSIATGIAISCTIDLSEAPPDWNLVNVYFDGGVVPMNDDGWKRASNDTLEIVGQSCELLESGDVFQVQIAAGCPTVVK